MKRTLLGPNLRPLKQDVVGDAGNTLWVLMGTIGMVLLIACANVANLILVRTEARQHELSIRAALGAGWGRIARELLTENLVLSLVGGALGLGFAYASLSAVAHHRSRQSRLAWMRSLSTSGAALDSVVTVCLRPFCSDSFR